MPEQILSRSAIHRHFFFFIETKENQSGESVSANPLFPAANSLTPFQSFNRRRSVLVCITESCVPREKKKPSQRNRKVLAFSQLVQSNWMSSQ
jgi:hypothetical protein